MVKLMEIQSLVKGMILNRYLSKGLIISGSLLIGLNIMFYRTVLLYCLAIICFNFALTFHLETKIDAIRLQVKNEFEKI